MLGDSSAGRTHKEITDFLSFERKRQEETSLMFILVPPLLQYAANDTPYYIVSRTENLREWTIRRYL